MTWTCMQMGPLSRYDIAYKGEIAVFFSQFCARDFEIQATFLGLVSKPLPETWW